MKINKDKGLVLELIHSIWKREDYEKLDGHPVGEGGMICETTVYDKEELYDLLVSLYPNCVGKIYEKGVVIGWTFEEAKEKTSSENMLVVRAIIRSQEDD